ncbi:hypothetical protein PS15m_002277 [Mucor circinelloides]
MVFASLKNKIVSFAGSVINQVLRATVSFSTAPAQKVLPSAGFKAYGYLEDVYHPRFQLAQDEGYRIMEKFGKIPVQTEYNSKVQFSSIAEAKAAMAADLLEACCSPLPGKFYSPQMYHNMSPYQQELTNKCADEESFEFVDYPDDGAVLASQRVPEANINLKKKKGHLKSLKLKLVRFSKK